MFAIGDVQFENGQRDVYTIYQITCSEKISRDELHMRDWHVPSWNDGIRIWSNSR